MEHPAASYRKIFETVEELNEPIPAKISGKRQTHPVDVADTDLSCPMSIC